MEEQQRSKWKRPRRNLQLRDLFVIVDDHSPRNYWTMARVIDTHPDSEGVVRSVKVTAGTATLDRPIEKLCAAVGT